MGRYSVGGTSTRNLRNVVIMESIPKVRFPSQLYQKLLVTLLGAIG